ncbi:putative box C/D snoRNA protein SPCC613.07 [Quercus lobata]|uniref:putative box C/D snoRNA protein SPCC613.07 n=1 Tax=Quercus lobata TaxID=97700 RepID=UPI001248F1B3|nr:putative box C/D snoRNA protein SPCC613.07 [Quercus lobata]
MENQEDPAPKPKDQPLCEECKHNPSKYKCPGCSVRSCGLSCVKAHKQRTGCTGKRNQTQFVPLSQFDDNLLISDYNLLEEVKRVSESAQRMRSKVCGYSHYKLPYHLKSLRKAAASRKTKLLFLPSGMSKREKNQTRYNNRKKTIEWTIEWQFHSTDVVLHDHGLNENMNLSSVIENHLKPGPWNHQLRQFCDEQLDCLKFFIRKYPKGPRSPFRELDVKAPIRQQLSNLVILEYPVIYVFLPSHNFDFEVVKEANPVTHKTKFKDFGSNPSPIPEGVPFKEEEIEEDNSSSDPHVFDLMKHVNSSPMRRFPHRNKLSEKVINNSSERSLLSRVETGNCSLFGSAEEPGVSEIREFDFDQGLIDAYSDLIAENNPDDFLDLEGVFTDEVIVEEIRNFSEEQGVFSAEEELEEGEILE